ncbi:DUF188 domain-containing protein [Alicyclobacillus ferrooxydans]|uniref:Uncharacterized protein n=1 Tax=Alicyclobacillus ferrooxydans TaxID=471514 RepID=A0A0P9CRM4_9BACL|nr:DUF188 domain-containing protein [Alicyclobacillus ferrooxydans]KPV42136.1 hypothetical protein AN477_18985 [Alicyclobacillus ferrooxydans]
MANVDEEHRNNEIVILIDADAAPRDTIVTADRLGAQFGAEVITISTVNHHFERTNHVLVDAHPQAVDMVIIARINRNKAYIVVTQDYGLAALSLGKGARAISPRGLIYTNDNIDRLLMERDIHARERRLSRRTKGPAARTTEDAVQFAAALEALLSEVIPSDA